MIRGCWTPKLKYSLNTKYFVRTPSDQRIHNTMSINSTSDAQIVLCWCQHYIGNSVNPTLPLLTIPLHQPSLVCLLPTLCQETGFRSYKHFKYTSSYIDYPCLKPNPLNIGATRREQDVFRSPPFATFCQPLPSHPSSLSSLIMTFRTNNQKPCLLCTNIILKKALLTGFRTSWEDLHGDAKTQQVVQRKFGALCACWAWI